MKRKAILTLISMSVLSLCTFASYSVNSTTHKVTKSTTTQIPFGDSLREDLSSPDVKTNKPININKSYPAAPLQNTKKQDFPKIHKAGDGYLDYDVTNPSIPDAFKDVVK